MIWLIGNKGMLGTEIALLLEKNGNEVVRKPSVSEQLPLKNAFLEAESRKNAGLVRQPTGLSHKPIAFTGTDREVDITDTAALDGFVKAQTAVDPVRWIINCAAYTAVDKAEDDVDVCRKLNAFGAANIAACAKKSGARLIHFSTDYVFNGKGNQPYKEDDAADPIGVYGMTKREGELAVLENNPSSIIIRTAWLYGKHGNNFVHTMLRLMNERDEVKVVDDQRGSPTWTFDLAQTVLMLINTVENGNNVPFGIYHYTNDGDISWFDFAKEIFKQGRELGRIAKDCAVKPCTSAEYSAKVKRPAYSVLDKSKIKSALGIEIPVWDKSLKEFLKNND